MASSSDQLKTAETVVASLTKAIGHLIRRLRADANPGGLNFSQTATLARLDDEGAMTTADLARSESMKPQSMATILSGLEEEALVKRSRHPTDGRQILFSLTREGIEARRKRTAAKQKWLLAKVSKLSSADQRTLLAAAELINTLGEP
ncbi:MAG TPA: MarR family transcriptional regulator [Rhizobium sp.]